MKTNIKDLTKTELIDWMQEQGEKRFRAVQVFQWLYNKKIGSFEEMQNVSKAVRQKLADHFYIGQLKRHQQFHSEDQSIKYVLELEDQEKVETVLMPHRDHYTICLSTQVGCAMGCQFCMTAKMGLRRNLTTGEIVSQVLEAWKDLPAGEGIRNIVFMGMGEPLHNYHHLLKALDIFTTTEGFNFSTRRITVSTSGLVPQLKRFSQESQVNVAISLNGTNDTLRQRLMPINKAYPLQKLMEACHQYPKDSRKRITFEYILLDGITDSIEQAQELVRLLHGLKCKVNLIPFNSTSDAEFRRPSWERITAFQRFLLNHGVVATLRISKGQDIAAACGQLIAGEEAKPQMV